jgi:hypothetical protein
VVFLGCFLYLPAVRTPFLLDDYLHASMVAGDTGLQRGPFDLYDFVNDADRASMLDRGLLPWWTHPHLTIRFFRPLSSLLRWMELRGLGVSPSAILLMHLHSLLWWLLAVLAVRALYQRSLAPRAALFATAIFALGPWHLLPIAWLANREVLLCTAIGIPSLSSYLRFRDERRARDALLAALGFLVAFGCGEYAFCLGGYVLADELLRRGESPLKRALSLLPFALPAAAYLVVRRLIGYGTYGSSFYADPLSEPRKLLMVAPRRLLALIAESWCTLGTDAWGTDASRTTIAVVVLVMGLLLVVPILRTLRALEEPMRARGARLLVGSLLALIPVLPAVPAPRVLGMSAIGMAAMVGLLLDHAWFPSTPPLRRGYAELTSLVATLMGFLQLVHGPVATFLAGKDLRASAEYYAYTSRRLAAHLAKEGRGEIQVLRGAAGAFFGPFAFAIAGSPPVRWRVLAQASHVLVVRTDERTLELRAPPKEALYPEGAGNLFRDAGTPAQVGDHYALPGLTVTILQVNEHGPTRARVRYDRPLDDAAYAFIDERVDGLHVSKLPRVGFGAPFDL